MPQGENLLSFAVESRIQRDRWTWGELETSDTFGTRVVLCLFLPISLPRGGEPECGLPSIPLLFPGAGGDGEGKGQQREPAGTWGPGHVTSCAMDHGKLIPRL